MKWRFWRARKPRLPLVELGHIGGQAILMASTSGTQYSQPPASPSRLSVREAMGLREETLQTSNAIRLSSQMQGATYPEDHAEYGNYLDAYRYVPYVARGVDIKAYYAWQTGYDLEGKPTPVDRASRSLGEINADSMLREATIWAMVFGNMYWRIKTQDPLTLEALNPIGIGMKREDGQTSNYVYRASPTAQVETLKPEQVLHLRFGGEPWEPFGYGLLRRVIVTVKQILFMEEKLPLIARRRADPWLEFQIGSMERPVSPDEFKRVKEMIQGRSSGEDLFHDGSIQVREVYQVASVGGRQTIDPLIQNFKNNLIAGLGVPEVYLGMGSTTLQGTAEHQEKGFESEIRSIQRQLKRFQEQQLWPLLGISPDVKVVWRPLKPDDRATLSRQLMDEIEHRVVTPEYARQRLGYPEDMEGDFLTSVDLRDTGEEPVED